MVTHLITCSVPIPHNVFCAKRRRKASHAFLLRRVQECITPVDIKNVSRLRNHQYEHAMRFGYFLQQQFCSHSRNSSISQEIILSEIVRLARALVHLYNKIAQWVFRIWVNIWIVVDDFRKTTFLNAFLYYALKVKLMGVSSSRYSTDSAGARFWCGVICAK